MIVSFYSENPMKIWLNFTSLYTLHPSLNFTMDKSRIKLSFLDTMVINNNGKVQTDIFYKPTDSKQYLLYTSCHPKHTRNSIPYNLARRLKTIVSDERTLHKRLEELEEFLIKRKYYWAWLKMHFKKQNLWKGQNF